MGTKESFQTAETGEKTPLRGFGSTAAAGSFIVLYQRSDTEKMAHSVGKTMVLDTNSVLDCLRGRQVSGVKDDTINAVFKSKCYPVYVVFISSRKVIIK